MTAVDVLGTLLALLVIVAVVLGREVIRLRDRVARLEGWRNGKP